MFCTLFGCVRALSENVSEKFFISDDLAPLSCLSPARKMHFANSMCVGRFDLWPVGGSRSPGKVRKSALDFVIWGPTEVAAATKHDQLNENGFVLRFLIHFSCETHHVAVQSFAPLRIPRSPCCAITAARIFQPENEHTQNEKEERAKEPKVSGE